MIKKSFFGFGKPKLRYSIVGSYEKESLEDIPLPSTAYLSVKDTVERGDEPAVRLGDRVRTGQRLRLTVKSPGSFVSPVTGTVKSMLPKAGFSGELYTSIAIEVMEDVWDEEFRMTAKTPSLRAVQDFLGSLPGHAGLGRLLGYQPPLKTFVISGIDQDLLVMTNQIALKTGPEHFKRGAEILKNITGAERVILLVSSRLASYVKNTGLEVREMDSPYPATLPKLVMRNFLGKEVPAGSECETQGVGFISAEALVSLGKAFSQTQVPIHKLLTVVGKGGSLTNARARIGTPVKDVLLALQIGTAEGDRVVLGGPMTGRALLSEETPVLYDTDAVMVQDREEIVRSSDTHCVNCGECVRACPAYIPVNMLIRFLENGMWEDAVNQYDLLSCVECGLCSYVCPARIPLFQHIMLGKHEFKRTASF
jgi:electron transport complex protein RnfC